MDTTVEETWEKMKNTLAMVHCIPGIEEAQEASAGKYKVKIMTKLGPISLRFGGNAELAVNEEQQTMEATVSMTDSRSGNVYGKFAMTLLTQDEEIETLLQIDADVVIAGKLGELAQPLVKRKADQIVREFSTNLIDYLKVA